MLIFPNAKVVLTVRDPERWYESVRGTIFQSRHLVTGTTAIFLKLVGGFRRLNLVNECSNQVGNGINKKGITDIYIYTYVCVCIVNTVNNFVTTNHTNPNIYLLFRFV